MCKGQTEGEQRCAEDKAAALRAAINRGETLREAEAETARIVDAAKKRVRLQDDLDAVAAKFGVADEHVRRGGRCSEGGQRTRLAKAAI